MRYSWGNFRYYPLTGNLYRFHSSWKRWISIKPREGGTLRTSEGFLSDYHIAWKCYYGDSPEGLIDHKDRNRKNNRISNLRNATPSQNQWNRGPNFKSITGHKNVYLHPDGRFYAQVRVGGEKKSVYGIPTIEAAVSEANKLRAKYHTNYNYKDEE